MKVKKIFFFLFLLNLFLGDKLEFMSVEEIKPGMKGIGKTVFSGTKIEEFEVEILGVLKNTWVKGDIILGRLKGGPLEKTGVIAGMSGSPVYINGKLIGAVAYSWGFAKEPLAGITPINEMLELFKSSSTDTKDSFPFDHSKKTSLFETKNNQNTQLIPLALPLMISGFENESIAQMDIFFNQFQFIPVQSGEAATDDFKEEDFIPGACLGVQLVRGDLNMTAIGTLTYREKDKILGFGHPMFQGGKTCIPMTAGYVYAIMPSQEHSFKLASSTKTLGEINNDLRIGISGLVGKMPSLIPVEIKTISPCQKLEHTYHFEIIKNEFLFPGLFFHTTFEAISASQRLFGKSTMSVNTEIYLKNHPPVSLVDYFMSEMAPLTVAFNSALPVSLLQENKFEKIEIEKISLTISMVEEQRTAELKRVYLSKKEVKKGEEFTLTLFIKPYLKEMFSQTIKLTVPLEVKEEMLEVKIMDAHTFSQWEKGRIPLKFQPESFDQLVKLFKDNPKGNELIVCLISNNKGMVIHGEEFPFLPSSMISLMSFLNLSGEGMTSNSLILLKKNIPVQYLVSGSKSVFVKIKKVF